MEISPSRIYDFRRVQPRKGVKTLPLRAIDIPPSSGQPSKGLLVGLHGWGANAQDLASLAPYLKLPDYEMIFPEAPFSHPYAPGGYMWYSFPADYDFRSMPDFDRQPDLAESRQKLMTWLTALEGNTGIPLSRTVLAGFSQGGAMTLDVGSQLPVAALIVMSGYLHAPISIQIENIPPILMVHGKQDPVVPIAAARQAHETLVSRGAAVNYQELNMGHEIRPENLNLMQSFVGGVSS
ncbi:MAG TPA: alpha/beta hydrolase [Elainellaceae cyanobacterium]